MRLRVPTPTLHTDSFTARRRRQSELPTPPTQRRAQQDVGTARGQGMASVPEDHDEIQMVTKDVSVYAI